MKKRRSAAATNSIHTSDQKLKPLAERKTRVTLAEYRELRINGYERRLLHQNLDDEAILWLVEQYLGEMGGVRELREFELAQHYNDALAREFAPLLVKRLREAHDLTAEMDKAAERAIADWDAGTINRAELRSRLADAYGRKPRSGIRISSHC